MNKKDIDTIMRNYNFSRPYYYGTTSGNTLIDNINALADKAQDQEDKVILYRLADQLQHSAIFDKDEDSKEKAVLFEGFRKKLKEILTEISS